MKATGIVRRIDDLGRVVIPKEIRRTMRIREGDPLEIYTDVGGEVIFKKYSPIGELSSLSAQCAQAITTATKLSVVICDRDHCIAAAGISKKETLERRIAPDLEQIIEERKAVSFDSSENRRALEGVERRICAAAPILIAGDVSGAVVMLASETCNLATESDLKLATVTAAFLGSQMEA